MHTTVYSVPKAKSKAKFVYKHENGKLPSSFDNFLTSSVNTHGYSLRSITNSRYKRVWGNTIHSLKLLQNEAVKIWNTIPKTIREAKSLKGFVDKYKAYLIENR